MLYPDFNELLRLSELSPRLRLHASQRTLNLAAGDYVSPFRGQGLEFHEVREYRPGDDVRNIDWRVTARTNRPHLKTFTQERERSVLLAVDANAGMRYGTRGTFKSVQAARAAALLGWKAHGGNDRVGAVVYGDVAEGTQWFPPSRSKRALWKALKLLCAPVTEAASKPIALERVLGELERGAPTGALIFIVSDFYDVTETLEKLLANLRRRCDIVLVAVQDPIDRAIVPLEDVIFTDAEGRKLRVSTLAPEAREAYARQWRENRMKLEDIAARRRIGIVDVHTEHDVTTDLRNGLRLLDRKGRRT
jgi:uncharacterized protein (DUF58 family)